jgi:hypothetical protein
MHIPPLYLESPNNSCFYEQDYLKAYLPAAVSMDRQLAAGSNMDFCTAAAVSVLD